jgi:xanthine dehydrogenase YagS FAD-binding subunit
VADARIALGGVATVPWRAKTAEQALRGQAVDDASIEAVADSAFAEARPHEHNAFKVALGRQTLARALRQAAALQI